jgi:hypothetical protein
MPRLYELPTHLQVEDQLIAGLTARQLLRLLLGGALAFGVWDQVHWLPDEVRLALAAVLFVIGVLFALVQPAGCSLDRWLMAAVLFMVLPRRLSWHPGTTPRRRTSREQVDWAELELHPDWLTPTTVAAHDEQSSPRSPFSLRFAWRRSWSWSWRKS